MAPYTLLITALLGLVAAQTPGKTREIHPKVKTWKCSKAGCKELRTALVLDSSAHPIHQKTNTTKGCGDWGSRADPTVCPDEQTCAKNCIMEGISNYSDYGVITRGSSMTLNMMGKKGVSSPRVYLLAEGEREYELLQLTGQEFTFDVDVSKLPCGMNGALYLSEMKEDGGRSKLNPAGASYGTGYCDAQCFVTPWVDGVGNIKGEGVCCNELDIWEANARSTHLAPHPCSKPGLYRCSGDECKSEGVCDKSGCGMNPYKVGDQTYYGTMGKKVDTTKPFTVVTQFPAKDGVLQGIVRYYIQNGKVMENAAINITNPIDDDYCDAHGAKRFMELGAMKGMGESMSRGMVLAMSIWWDETGFMSWLDSSASNAGPCNATEGDPKVIVTKEAQPSVTFSNIRWGDIGTTFKGKAYNRWNRMK